MIDKINIKIPLAESEWERVATLCNLIEYYKADTGERFYRNAKTSYFEGLGFVEVGKRGLLIKGSLHKFYNSIKNGKADNSGLFTITQAKEAISLLEKRICVSFDNAKISSFEIAYNIPTSKPAREYIGKMIAIGRGAEPQLLEEARLKKDRQKTTRRDKEKRKYYKVYDKAEEVRERQKKEISPTLRVETSYKRQSISPYKLVADLPKLLRSFAKDWGKLEFKREYKTKPGTHASQAIKAIAVRKLGIDGFLRAEAERYENGIITQKQYRLSKEFAKDYKEKHENKIIELISEEETEYKNAINQVITMLL